MNRTIQDENLQRRKVRRIFVEKKKGYNAEAYWMYRDFRDFLGISGLEGVRVVYRYDITDLTDSEYADSVKVIFSESLADAMYEETLPVGNDERAFAVEYLPGQFDQKADSASQCIQLLTLGEKPRCKTARVIILKGNISDSDFEKVKNYCINPVDSMESGMDKPDTLDTEIVIPGDISQIDGFCSMTVDELVSLKDKLGLAMTIDDLEFCRKYFSEKEHRDPTITEIRVLDTYWSDHCRHSTFLTRIRNIEIDDSPFGNFLKTVYDQYTASRKYVYGDQEKDISLMDLATIAMKVMRKDGRLDDMEVSDEVNACSIAVNAKVNGKDEEWLVMFKNETHNHPTEIEPFGGAATCLGGGIRDPLSGRAYVYQAMRITGSGDPRTPFDKTLPGKLPQRKITTEAAAGYSSYGNQIGLAGGQVSEIYDEGYVAKRMELGALIGAVPRENVVRAKPEPGDVVILVGGRTGRDGCGGATGSSKEQDEKALLTCGAEVQKGNPSLERNIVRLFRDPRVSRMIKKCNDFGAGGVSVAIGELADGLDIDLDSVPTKYEGLDGTELAISESQERMAVVISSKDRNEFIKAAMKENLEATQVAVVTDTGRLRMKWRNKTIVDISREFLNTGGVRQNTDVKVVAPEIEAFGKNEEASPLEEAWVSNLQKLENCCQKGLAERFDSTNGAGTVLMPFGGKYQLSPAEGMVAKLPVLDGDTTTCTMMTYGYNPRISRWSPFHGAVYAVVEAIAKLVAMGGDYRNARMSMQEFFEKLGTDPVRWGKPFSALLGAYYAEMKLGIPSIGGKDSMSGTFKDLDVPPTLVAFAVTVGDVENVISTEFKKAGSQVVLVRLRKDEYNLPDFDQLHMNYTRIHEIIKEKAVLAAHSVRQGGVAEAVSRMCFGNMIGVELNIGNTADLFAPDYGSIILEIKANADVHQLLHGLDYQVLGTTLEEPVIRCGGTVLNLNDLADKWIQPLESVFPTKVDDGQKPVETFSFNNASAVSIARTGSSGKFAKPRVLIPVFPGTNTDYDIAKAFKNAGGTVEKLVIRNLSPEYIREASEYMAECIKSSQILVFAGDEVEPNGPGKFTAAVFRNPRIREAVNDLLQNRDGLILGISSGFHALLRLGLLPYGEFREQDSCSPALTQNSIGRYVSCMVQTRIASTKSPWFSNVNVGDIHTIAVSHGEGRFVATEEVIAALAANGQIATQYVDLEGKATYDIRFNPIGSMYAIEGITSPDGRILGKLGHSERKGTYVCINVPG
ncbi:MAG TPA: phosphoribosylformylglycinamidine synthase, partial [Clostridiales bacterium]|nr:phosphoribosylformylglycinamidine synthase [Clostridiales bacterium]